jgi:threonine/homoserine/homoserine lactone efflux protein
MSAIFFKGILLGFSLSFLIGPLLFTLVQTSIERGLRAGFSIAFGIWFSDLLFVISVLFFVEKLNALTHLPNFEKWAGFLGGLLLVGFGVSNFFEKQKLRRLEKKTESHGVFGHFLRGFLINTINPFTVFFWLGVTTTVIVPHGWSGFEAFIFFAGMLGMLILTDSLKVFLAQKISRWLTERHIQQIRYVLGALLVVFGVVLIFKAFK